MTTAARELDPNLKQVLSDVVAVVDVAQDGRLVIWHVDISPDNGLARMAGAWVLSLDESAGQQDEPAGLAAESAGRAADLLRGRRVLASAAGAAAVAALAVDIAGFVDPAGTLDDMADRIATLQAAFDAEARKLVSPTWPALPEPLDFASVAASMPDGTGHVAVALGAARWLEDAAVRWEKIEAQRVARKFLAPFGGPTRRPLHLRCR